MLTKRSHTNQGGPVNGTDYDHVSVADHGCWLQLRRAERSRLYRRHHLCISEIRHSLTLGYVGIEDWNPAPGQAFCFCALNLEPRTERGWKSREARL